MPEINAIVRTPHGFLENCFLERFGVFSGEFTVGDDRVELLRGERVIDFERANAVVEPEVRISAFHFIVETGKEAVEVAFRDGGAYTEVFPSKSGL